MNWKAQAFATCLAVLYFKKHLSSQKDQWELVAQKSAKWLKKHFPTVQDAMTKKAEQFI